MNENILSGILIFGAIQAIFFAFLFLTKKNKEIPDKIIVYWLFVLTINIISIAFSKAVNNNYLKVLQISFTLLHGPFLYLYTCKLTIEKTKYNNTDYLHFFPFVFIVLLSLVIASFSLDTKILIKLIAIAGIMSGLTYCVLVFINLIEHKKRIKDKFSFSETINLQWLFRLTVGLFIIWIGGSISGILLRFFNFNIPILWMFTVIPVFIFYIGFYGIKQNIIYSSNIIHIVKQENVLTKANRQNSDRYKKSGLQKQSMKLINERLLNVMQTEQLFLNSTLSLLELSEHLKIPSHHITQTLNEYTNQSFYDFVNLYRVEEFKKKVFAPENSSFSLLGIAFDCGFNSKSSFNRIFKKYTNQAPSEYKNTFRQKF